MNTSLGSSRDTGNPNNRPSVGGNSNNQGGNQGREQGRENYRGGNYRGGGGGGGRGGGNRQHNYNQYQGGGGQGGGGGNYHQNNGNNGNNRYNNNRSNHNQNHNAGPSSAPQTRVMGSFKPVSSAPANADPLVTQLSALISKLHSPVAATDSFKIVPIAELDIAANIEKLTAVIVNGAQGRFLKPSSDDPADDSDDDSDAEADAKDEPKPPSKTHDPDWLAERALEKGRGDATSVASEGFIHFDEDAPKRPPTSTLIINTFKTNLYYTTATDLAGLLPPLLMNSLLSLPLATATYTSLLLSLISSASTPHHKTLAPRLNTLLHAALSHAIDTLIAPTATPTHFDAAEHYTTAYGTAVAGVRVVTMLQYAGALEGRVFEQLVGLIDKFNGESGDDNSSRRDVLLNVLMHGVITGIHLGMEVGDVVEDIERIVKGRKGVFNTGRKSVMLEIDEGESDEDEEEEEDDEFQYSDNLTSLYRIIQDFKGDGSVPPETAKLWADKELLDQFKEELQGSPDVAAMGDESPEFVDYVALSFPDLIVPCVLVNGTMERQFPLLTVPILTPRYPIFTSATLSATNPLSTVLALSRGSITTLTAFTLLTALSHRPHFSATMTPIGTIAAAAGHVLALTSSMGHASGTTAIIEALIVQCLVGGDDALYFQSLIIAATRCEPQSVGNAVAAALSILTGTLASITPSARERLATFIGVYVVETTPVNCPAEFLLWKKWEAGVGGDALLSASVGKVVQYVEKYKGAAGEALFPIGECEKLMELARGEKKKGGEFAKETEVFAEAVRAVLTSRGSSSDVVAALKSSDEQTDKRGVAFGAVLAEVATSSDLQVGGYKQAFVEVVGMDCEDGGAAAAVVWGAVCKAFVEGCGRRKDVVDAAVGAGVLPLVAVVAYAVESECDAGIDSGIRAACRSRDVDEDDDDDDDDEEAMTDGGGKGGDKGREECKSAVVWGLEQFGEKLDKLKKEGKGTGDKSVILLNSLRRRLVESAAREGVVSGEQLGGVEGVEGVEGVVKAYY